MPLQVLAEKTRQALGVGSPTFQPISLARYSQALGEVARYASWVDDVSQDIQAAQHAVTRFFASSLAALPDCPLPSLYSERYDTHELRAIPPPPPPAQYAHLFLLPAGEALMRGTQPDTIAAPAAAAAAATAAGSSNGSSQAAPTTPDQRKPPELQECLSNGTGVEGLEGARAQGSRVAGLQAEEYDGLSEELQQLPSRFRGSSQAQLLVPIEVWLQAYKEAQARLASLERLRLKVDAARRKLERRGKAFIALQAKLLTQQQQHHHHHAHHRHHDRAQQQRDTEQQQHGPEEKSGTHDADPAAAAANGGQRQVTVLPALPAGEKGAEPAAAAAAAVPPGANGSTRSAGTQQHRAAPLPGSTALLPAHNVQLQPPQTAAATDAAAEGPSTPQLPPQSTNLSSSNTGGPSADQHSAAAAPSGSAAAGGAGAAAAEADDDESASWAEAMYAASGEGGLLAAHEMVERKLQPLLVEFQEAELALSTLLGWLVSQAARLRAALAALLLDASAGVTTWTLPPALLEPLPAGLGIHPPGAIIASPAGPIAEGRESDDQGEHNPPLAAAAATDRDLQHHSHTQQQLLQQQLEQGVQRGPSLGPDFTCLSSGSSNSAAVYGSCSPALPPIAPLDQPGTPIPPRAAPAATAAVAATTASLLGDTTRPGVPAPQPRAAGTPTPGGWGQPAWPVGQEPAAARAAAEKHILHGGSSSSIGTGRRKITVHQSFEDAIRREVQREERELEEEDLRRRQSMQQHGGTLALGAIHTDGGDSGGLERTSAVSRDSSFSCASSMGHHRSPGTSVAFVPGLGVVPADVTAAAGTSLGGLGDAGSTGGTEAGSTGSTHRSCRSSRQSSSCSSCSAADKQIGSNGDAACMGAMGTTAGHPLPQTVHAAVAAFDASADVAADTAVQYDATAAATPPASNPGPSHVAALLPAVPHMMQANPGPEAGTAAPAAPAVMSVTSSPETPSPAAPMAAAEGPAAPAAAAAEPYNPGLSPLTGHADLALEPAGGQPGVSGLTGNAGGQPDPSGLTGPTSLDMDMSYLQRDTALLASLTGTDDACGACLDGPHSHMNLMDHERQQLLARAAELEAERDRFTAAAAEAEEMQAAATTRARKIDEELLGQQLPSRKQQLLQRQEALSADMAQLRGEQAAIAERVAGFDERTAALAASEQQLAQDKAAVEHRLGEAELLRHSLDARSAELSAALNSALLRRDDAEAAAEHSRQQLSQVEAQVAAAAALLSEAEAAAEPARHLLHQAQQELQQVAEEHELVHSQEADTIMELAKLTDEQLPEAAARTAHAAAEEQCLTEQRLPSVRGQLRRAQEEAEQEAQQAERLKSTSVAAGEQLSALDAEAAQLSCQAAALLAMAAGAEGLGAGEQARAAAAAAEARGLQAAATTLWRATPEAGMTGNPTGEAHTTPPAIAAATGGAAPEAPAVAAEAAALGQPEPPQRPAAGPAAATAAELNEPLSLRDWHRTNPLAGGGQQQQQQQQQPQPAAPAAAAAAAGPLYEPLSLRDWNTGAGQHQQPPPTAAPAAAAVAAAPDTADVNQTCRLAVEPSAAVVSEGVAAPAAAQLPETATAPMAGAGAGGEAEAGAEAATELRSTADTVAEKGVAGPGAGAEGAGRPEKGFIERLLARAAATAAAARRLLVAEPAAAADQGPAATTAAAAAEAPVAATAGEAGMTEEAMSAVQQQGVAAEAIGPAAVSAVEAPPATAAVVEEEEETTPATVQQHVLVAEPLPPPTAAVTEPTAAPAAVEFAEDGHVPASRDRELAAIAAAAYRAEVTHNTELAAAAEAAREQQAAAVSAEEGVSAAAGRRVVGLTAGGMQEDEQAEGVKRHREEAQDEAASVTESVEEIRTAAAVAFGAEPAAAAGSAAEQQPATTAAAAAPDGDREQDVVELDVQPTPVKKIVLMLAGPLGGEQDAGTVEVQGILVGRAGEQRQLHQQRLLLEQGEGDTFPRTSSQQEASLQDTAAMRPAAPHGAAAATAAVTPPAGAEVGVPAAVIREREEPGLQLQQQQQRVVLDLAGPLGGGVEAGRVAVHGVLVDNRPVAPEQQQLNRRWASTGARQSWRESEPLFLPLSGMPADEAAAVQGWGMRADEAEVDRRGPPATAAVGGATGYSMPYQQQRQYPMAGGAAGTRSRPDVLSGDVDSAPIGGPLESAGGVEAADTDRPIMPYTAQGMLPASSSSSAYPAVPPPNTPALPARTVRNAYRPVPSPYMPPPPTRLPASTFDGNSSDTSNLLQSDQWRNGQQQQQLVVPKRYGTTPAAPAASPAGPEGDMYWQQLQLEQMQRMAGPLERGGFGTA